MNGLAVGVGSHTARMFFLSLSLPNPVVGPMRSMQRPVSLPGNEGLFGWERADHPTWLAAGGTLRELTRRGSCVLDRLRLRESKTSSRGQRCILDR